jgi:hypothetical protein
MHPQIPRNLRLSIADGALFYVLRTRSATGMELTELGERAAVIDAND